MSNKIKMKIFKETFDKADETLYPLDDDIFWEVRKLSFVSIRNRAYHATINSELNKALKHVK